MSKYLWIGGTFEETVVGKEGISRNPTNPVPCF